MTALPYYWVGFAGPHGARIWYCLPALDRDSAQASGWTRLGATLGLQERAGDAVQLEQWICISLDLAGAAAAAVQKT